VEESEWSNDSAEVPEIEGLGESGVDKHDMPNDPMDDTNTNSHNLRQNELGPDKEDSTNWESNDSDETTYDYPYVRTTPIFANILETPLKLTVDYSHVGKTLRWHWDPPEMERLRTRNTRPLGSDPHARR